MFSSLTLRRDYSISHRNSKSSKVSPTKTSHSIQNSSTNPKKWYGDKGLLLSRLFLILTGMIICGIPLAIMSTLYVQENINCQTTTTTVATMTSTVTVTVLPQQCFSYTENNDSSRNVNAGAGFLCDSTLVTAWYRFIGNGTMIPTDHVTRDSCTTQYPGSYNGTMPSTPGSTEYGKLCVNNNGYLCVSPMSGNLIGATHCGSYYVYYLTRTFSCNSRYCTTN